MGSQFSTAVMLVLLEKLPQGIAIFLVLPKRYRNCTWAVTHPRAPLKSQLSCAGVICQGIAPAGGPWVEFDPIFLAKSGKVDFW